MSKKQIKSNPSTYRPLSEQTGTIDKPLTNDLLFKLLMQENQEVLRAFLAALLNLDSSEITSVNIENPYRIGSVITDKTTIMDIEVTVNNNQRINLEMQVAKQKYWKDRSIIYLCRTFDKIKEGETYDTLLPARHIGILDFDVPDLNDAFFYNFYLMDKKSHKIYSDRFVLSMLNLNKADIASDEDIQSGLQYWAKLFKSTTWEELKMLAKQNTIFKSAANTINDVLQDHIAYMQIKKREEMLLLQKQERLESEQKDAVIAEKDAEIALLKEELRKAQQQAK